MKPAGTLVWALCLFTVAVHAEAEMPLARTTASYTVGTQFVFEVTRDRVLKTPVWKLNSDSPPLSPRKAEQLATAKFRQLISNTKGWERVRIALEDFGDGLHWIYVVEFRSPSSGRPPHVNVVVLMDGTVVEPKIVKTP